MPVSTPFPRLLRVLRTGIIPLIFAACAHPVSVPADLDQVLSLREGESAAVPGGVVVRLLALQDSRCPSDVVCVTAGDVVIALEFSDAGKTRTDTLRLHMPPRSADYDGLHFEPTDVTPYPDTRIPAPKKTLNLRVTATR